MNSQTTSRRNKITKLNRFGHPYKSTQDRVDELKAPVRERGRMRTQAIRWTRGIINEVKKMHDGVYDDNNNMVIPGLSYTQIMRHVRHKYKLPVAYTDVKKLFQNN